MTISLQQELIVAQKLQNQPYAHHHCFNARVGSVYRMQQSAILS